MTILFIQMGFAGQDDGVSPKRGKMISSDSITAITAPGYLNSNAKTTGITFTSGDLIDANYNDAAGNVVATQFFVNKAANNVITLVNVSNGNVTAGNAILTTADNTATTIFAITVPEIANCVVTATAQISAILNTGASASYTTPSTAAAWYNGTSVASVGTLPTITTTHSGSLTTSCAWVVTGNVLELQATGVTSDTILWNANYSYTVLNA